MDATPSEALPGRSHYTTERRSLLMLVDAFRGIGIEVSLPEVMKALLSLKRDGGTWTIRLSEPRLRYIHQQWEHQALINRVLTACCKRDGYEVIYDAIYPEYVTACKAQGIVPYCPKTFKNRAFQRHHRWERYGAGHAAKGTR